MTAIAFDTLEFTKRLMQAGAPRELTEATAQAFKDASGEAELATRGDLREMEYRLNGQTRPIKWMLAPLLGGVMSLVFKSFFV